MNLHIGGRLRRICSRKGLYLPELGRRSRSSAPVEARLSAPPLAKGDALANLKKLAEALELEDVYPYQLFLDGDAGP